MGRSDKLRRAAACGLSFAIPAVVMLCVFRSMGMAPWGDRTVLISDMADQYVDFFCALKQGDVFFSWSKSMGTGYIGVFSYYVSSPLSLLTLLVPNENMPVGLMLLTVLKLGLAGLSYAIYSAHKFPGAEITTVLCASCYGLMAYNVAYSLSLMWLDGVIWLPLILLALERILDGKGAGPFIAALSVCFVSTWYISYMIGIFCCIYLAVRLIALRLDRKALLRVLKRFFGGAVCALGLTAWIWLPTFMSMFYGKFQDTGFHFSRWVYGPLSSIFRQLLPGQYTNYVAELPNIFCGTATVLLAIAYFFLKKIPLRERLASAGAVAVLFGSLWSTVADRVWHLFKYPNWFPYRYSFVVSFFLIYLANQALPGLWKALDGKVKLPRGVPQAMAAAVLVLTVAQLGRNAFWQIYSLNNAWFGGYRSYGEYWDCCTGNAAMVDAARADSGGEFCRVGSTSDLSHNAPLAFGYPGINHYSSVYDGGLNAQLKDLGLAQAWYWCASYGSTPVTDALFDLRYTISEEELPGHELVDEIRGLKLWKNPDVLPLAFLSGGGRQDAEGDGPFERQNSLISGLMGEETVIFRAVPAAVERGEPEATTFTFTGTGEPVYADLSAEGMGDVLVNGETVMSLGRSEQMSVHYLCTPRAGEICTVTVQHPAGWQGELWQCDLDALHSAVERLDNTKITEVGKDGLVRLTAVSEEGQTLATTIPAEDGWTACVDGRKADLSAWMNGVFLSVDLPAGEHEVVLRYTAPGLIPGVALGIVSALALVGLELLRRRRKT